MQTNIHQSLAKALGIENLEASKQEEIITSTGALIYQSVLMRALEEMPDEQVDEFEKITATNPTPEVVFDFFRLKIPNFEAMIADEAQKFMSEIKK